MIKRKKLLKIILIIIVTLAIMLMCVAILALHKQNTLNYNIMPSDEVLTKLAVASVIGKSVTVTEDEINSFIEYTVQKNDNEFKSNKIKVKSVYLRLKPNNTADLYIPFLFYGINLDFSTNLDIKLINEEGYISFKLHNTKIGSLCIPKRIVINKLVNKIPYIHVNDSDEFYIPSNIKFNVKNQNVEIKISKLETDENKIVLTIIGGMDAIKSYIKSIF